MSKDIHMIGERYGRFTVTAEASRGKYGQRVVCLCDCGTVKIVGRNTLITGNSKSCGCLKLESSRQRPITHGHAGSSVYAIWKAMKYRCNNANYRLWKDYGGRGITVCDRWLESFENFLEDMGEKPKGMEIDRIDNNKGYSPENCHWVTRLQNSHNRRSNLVISYNGESLVLAEWARRVGLKYTTLRARIYRHNWSIEKALTMR